MRYNSDEGGSWRMVDFNYLLTKTRGKMIKSAEDTRKKSGDDDGLILYLTDGAAVQFLYEQDTIGIYYMTP